MSRIELTARLILISYSGLADANRGNPFWSKGDAMTAINGARKLATITSIKY